MKLLKRSYKVQRNRICNCQQSEREKKDKKGIGQG